MATFLDTTGKWELDADDEARQNMTEFLAKYVNVTDLVTITSTFAGERGIRWTGDLNGRVFTMMQSYNTSDWAHDIEHDTYGNNPPDWARASRAGQD
jgi:hypothetical protein